MNQEFARVDGGYYKVIANEDGITYTVGQFDEKSGREYCRYDFKIDNIELTKAICEALTDAFESGVDHAGGADNYLG